MTKKIVAIGGGENGRPGYLYETKEFDEEIVRLTNKTNPNFLFIGFAGEKWEKSYFDVMSKIYKDKFGCNVDFLSVNDLNKKELIREKIENANIIYVGGGNTLRCMTLFRKYMVDKLLKAAWEKGTVMCGVSAGAICWAQFGNSDARKFTSNSSRLIKVTGLKFLNILLCPHYNAEKHRQNDLKRMMKKVYKIPAIALDNGAALEVIDNNYRILISIPGAKARKCYWKQGKYIVEELEVSSDFKDIDLLVRI